MYNTNKRGSKRPPFTFLGMEKNAVDMLYRKKKKSALFASQKITFDIRPIASELICDGKHAE